MKVTFQGLVINPKCTTIEDYFEILDAFDAHNIVVLNWEQNDAKWEYDRVICRLRLHHKDSSLLTKALVRHILTPFDLYNIRISA